MFTFRSLSFFLEMKNVSRNFTNKDDVFLTVNHIVLGNIYVFFLLTLMESHPINTCTMPDCSHGAGSCCRCSLYEMMLRKKSAGVFACVCDSVRLMFWIIECWALCGNLTNTSCCPSVGTPRNTFFKKHFFCG